MEFISGSAKQTQKLGKIILAKIKKATTVPAKVGTVVCLWGELGSGKTTLTQALARELGVKARVISPTFVLMKNYQLKTRDYKLLVHIDAYRLEHEDELLKLGWQEIISDPKNLIFIEWPEKVKKIIPRKRFDVHLKHLGKNKRKIKVVKH